MIEINSMGTAFVNAAQVFIENKCRISQSYQCNNNQIIEDLQMLPELEKNSDLDTTWDSFEQVHGKSDAKFLV